MLRTLLDLRNYGLRAIDKDLGSVEDFYFDDRLWTVRYLVADTGNWLSGRTVLIGLEALGPPNEEDRVFPVSLTSTEVENSPGIESDLPFSLEKERELRLFFQWREYWDDEIFIQRTGYSPLGSPGFGAAEGTPPGQPANTPAAVHANPHLRSANEVQGYAIRAQDGDIGHVEDFLIREPSWEIRYLVMKTGNWLSGKKFLISPLWVKSIDWSHQALELDMTREKIEKSPEFSVGKPLTKDDEARLYDHYGKQRDWE
jgi:hypothetical protein